MGNTPFEASEDIQVFANIVQNEPKLPEATPELESLLKGLLTKSVDMRLGSEQSGGAEAIRNHPWFKGLDWVHLESEFPPAYWSLCLIVLCLPNYYLIA